jgi:hypothetical protein
MSKNNRRYNSREDYVKTLLIFGATIALIGAVLRWLGLF